MEIEEGVIRRGRLDLKIIPIVKEQAKTCFPPSMLSSSSTVHVYRKV